MEQFLYFVLIGLAAGWLAGQIMNARGNSLVGNLIVGVIGAVLGGWLFGLLQIQATGLMGKLVVATGGAIILIALLRVITRRR